MQFFGFFFFTVSVTAHCLLNKHTIYFTDKLWFLSDKLFLVLHDRKVKEARK